MSASCWLMTGLSPAEKGLKAAAAAGAAATFLAKVAEGMTRGTVGDKEGGPAAENELPARLESRPLTGADLVRFVDGLARDLAVADVLHPRGLRVRSYRISADRVDAEARSEFLNSFIAEDLARAGDALRRGDVGAGLRTYLSDASD